MTITQLLQGISLDFRLDVEILLATILKQSRSFLYAHLDWEISASDLIIFEQYWSRRKAGEPLAYIVQCKEFWGLPLFVNQYTLIPRPETECLIEYILTHVKAKMCQVLEIGTGSGAIACAIASERPHWEIVATDICGQALTVAEQNSQRLQLRNITYKVSNIFTALSGERFDIIVSNPPYVAPDSPYLQDLTFEPRQALVAEDQGLAVLKQLLDKASDYLTPGGVLVLEHGYNQAQHLQIYSSRTPLTWIETCCDFSGHPRVSIFKG